MSLRFFVLGVLESGRQEAGGVLKSFIRLEDVLPLRHRVRVIGRDSPRHHGGGQINGGSSLTITVFLFHRSPAFSDNERKDKTLGKQSAQHDSC